jgi:FdhE protein
LELGVQRILQPGEIESLDRIEFPRVRLPQPATLFTERAARLRQKAEGHPIADYLRFLALVDLQAKAAATVATQPVAEAVIAQRWTTACRCCPRRCGPIRPGWACCGSCWPACWRCRTCRRPCARTPRPWRRAAMPNWKRWPRPS